MLNEVKSAFGGKTKITIILICNLLICNLQFSQTYSDITYDAGTSVEVQTGADICATNIYINGTWSGGGTICLGALPVSLSSFTHAVNKRDVTLNWVTEWELNNLGFDVERRKPEGNWQKVGFVQGTGTTNEQKAYAFKDEKLSVGRYEYRLKQVDYNGNYEYFALENDVDIKPPQNFSMSQNYPNPSNPKSKIDYEIPVDGKVTIRLYDILGKEAASIVNETKIAGYYSAEFDGTNLSSGVYFYRIIVEGGTQKFSKTLKMILVK